MAEHASPPLAHHFDSLEQQSYAGSLGMWLFLVTEIMFFGGLFVSYAVYRYWFPAAFAEGGTHLDLLLGTLNTGLLLVSSFTVVLALHAAKCNDSRGTVRMLIATMLLGSAFLGVKGYEYWHKAHEQLIPGQNFQLSHLENPEVDPDHVELFISLYFAMTGLHAAHMVIGIGMFFILMLLARRHHFSENHFGPLENAGLYWHFVDIVWIFLFPLLYMI